MKMLDKLYNIDARNITTIIQEENIIQTTITSPPYYDMKDYGSDNQVGYGQSYNDYLNDLQSIFKNVLDVTKEDGTLWIVIDTFKRNNHVVTLPFDLSNKLSEIGWNLQEIIIWKKDKTVPWSANGFMQRKFEYILFFSKSSTYKSNKDRVRIYDTQQLKKWWVKYPERYNPKGKVLDEIWEFPIPVQGSWGDKYIRHFCPLPKDMVKTMIDISTDEGDIVLDPFAGSGTVLSQSAYMNRKYIGFELNEEYIGMFKSYLSETFKSGQQEYDKMQNAEDQLEFENRILNLRALKYGRLLLNHLENKITDRLKITVTRDGIDNLTGKSIVNYSIIGCDSEQDISSLIQDYVKKPPLSKFGIIPKFNFEKTFTPSYDNVYYCYSKTNSYSYMRNVEWDTESVKVISNIMVDLTEKDFE